MKRFWQSVSAAEIDGYRKRAAEILASLKDSRGQTIVTTDEAQRIMGIMDDPYIAKLVASETSAEDYAKRESNPYRTFYAEDVAGFRESYTEFVKNGGHNLSDSEIAELMDELDSMTDDEIICALKDGNSGVTIGGNNIFLLRF